MRKKRFIPILIVVFGIAVFVILRKMRPAPPQAPVKKEIPVVEILEAVPSDHDVVITGTGTLYPVDRVNLQPEVSGKIVYLSKNMRNGGTFKKGETLFRIDPREYELAVKSAEAEVKRQQVQLSREQMESEVAKSEWERYSKENPDAVPGELTLRKPQLELQQAALKAAEAKLESAKLRLDKTVIRAPFGGRVVQRNVSRGQVVAPGTVLSSIQGNKKYEVSIPLTGDDLKWVDFEKVEKGTLTAKVNFVSAGKKVALTGTVRTDEAELDKRSRMGRVVIEVEDKESTVRSGMFASVEVPGGKLENSFVIPRHALRDGKIYLMKEKRLSVNSIKLLRLQDGKAIIDGIIKGDKVIISPLEVAVEGMELKVGRKK